MRAEPARRWSLRPLPKWLLFGLVTVVTAMVAVALLSEVFSSGGDTIYLAQISPGNSQAAVTQPSIVVVGYGTASAPADTATVQLLIARSEDFDSGPARPTPGATPGAAQVESVEPIIESLTASGVSPGTIRTIASPALSNLFFGPSGEFLVRIDFTIANPGADQLTMIVNAAGQAALENQLTLTLVGVGYSVSDCAALVGQARQRATDDAEARAQQQAQALGITLGKLLLSSEVPGPFPDAASGCAPTPDVDPVSSFSTGAVGITVPAFDPGAPPQATAYVRISLAFAIPEDDDADD
jgi:hypothetical protein